MILRALPMRAFAVVGIAASIALAAPVATGPPNVPEFKPAFPAQTRAPEVRTTTPLEVTTIASGFDKPWAIAFLPDGRFLVTEKPTGRLYVVTRKGAKSSPVEGLPKVDGRGQGGLLDVEVAPDFATSGLVYWTYSEPRTGGNGLAVARGKLVESPVLRIDGLEVVFRMQPTLQSTMHSGGRLVFAPDSTLFVTLGERSIPAGRAQAQDLASHFGKVVRIRPDGAVPPGNPFVAKQGARPEIWSSGHRNILSAALDDRNRLWIVEMGPQGGDELNLVTRGGNYGYPRVSNGSHYGGRDIPDHSAGDGFEAPKLFWTPSISPSSLMIYSGAMFPQWRGDAFIGALSGEALIRVDLDGTNARKADQWPMGARIREVEQAPDGAIWLLQDGDSGGRLLRLSRRG